MFYFCSSSSLISGELRLVVYQLGDRLPGVNRSLMELNCKGRRARFGAFEVHLRSGQLHKHGIRLRLQDQPFQVLALLLEHPGELVTREELREKLWPVDTFVDFDTGLNNAIKKLRDALQDSAEEPRYIETLPRRGYRFIAQVENGNGDLPLSAAAEPRTDVRTAPEVVASSEFSVSPVPTPRVRGAWIAW